VLAPEPDSPSGRAVPWWAGHRGHRDWRTRVLRRGVPSVGRATLAAKWRYSSTRSRHEAVLVGARSDACGMGVSDRRLGSWLSGPSDRTPMCGWDPSSSSGRNADALAHRPPSQGSRSRQITYSCQPSASRAHTCSRAPSVRLTVMLKLHSRRRVQVARDRLAAHPCESVYGGEGVDVAGGEVGAVADQP
jgi:hypothetical protein